jgi:hypothetical protein
MERHRIQQEKMVAQTHAGQERQEQILRAVEESAARVAQHTERITQCLAQHTASFQRALQIADRIAPRRDEAPEA